MGSEHFPLRQNGIYHNLPQFHPSITNLTAIVTGANGISGFHTCRALLDSPQRWSKIYALSRRPPPEAMMNLLSLEQRSKIQHVASDFLKDLEEIAMALNESGVVKVDYVFFYSYLQPKPDPKLSQQSNAEELVAVNTSLLKNFLEVLSILKLQPKRILLQTGAKNYGVHIGRHRVPSLESDPQPKHLQPNFYYSQEEVLFKYCEDHPETGWNVIMPAWIIGATNNAQMNAMYPYAVYAAVAAHRKRPLVFPGDWASWQGYQHQSSARLTGYLSEWVVLEEKCKNQRFNSNDTGTVSWDRCFERLAAWFGVSGGVQGPDDNPEVFQEIKGRQAEETPMGYGPPTTRRFKFSLTDWARDEENHAAWKEIMKESGGKVSHDPFNDIESHFPCGDDAFMTIGCISMNKARLAGWTGFVDTMNAIWEMYMEMGGDGKSSMGMIPEMQVKTNLPLV